MNRRCDSLHFRCGRALGLACLLVLSLDGRAEAQSGDEREIQFTSTKEVPCPDKARHKRIVRELERIDAILREDQVNMWSQDPAPPDRESAEESIRRPCGTSFGRQGSGGIGSGALPDPESHDLGDFPVDLLAVDLDGVAPDDLAVLNQDSNDVSVLLGIAGGDFTAANPSYTDATEYPTGTRPNQMASGDFNEDTHQDLVTANQNNFVTGDVTLLLGNGNGSLQAPIPIAVGQMPTDIEAGDFDEDENLDFVTTDLNTQQVWLVTGNGDGTFDPPVSIPTLGFPQALAVGDLDMDENLDIVTTGDVLLGNGDGTFDPAQSFITTFLPSLVTIADVNDDTKPDVVTINSSSNSVAILIGDGNGGLETLAQYVIGNAGWNVEIDDLDLDGHVDLAISNFSSTHVSIAWGNGDGTFLGAPIYPIADTTNSLGAGLALGHFDSDELVDLAVGRDNRDATLLPGKAGGTFGDPLFLANQDGFFVAAGELNENGMDDLVFAPRDVPTSLQDVVQYREQTGDFTFDPPVDLELPDNDQMPNFVLATDIDDNDDLDLVTANNDSGDISILLGNGAGAFAIQPPISTGTEPVRVASGRLNADTDPDIAVANAGTFPNLNGTISVVLSDGLGGFDPAVDVLTGVAPDSVVIADFDGDTNGDIATTVESPQFTWSIKILPGDGSGGFGPAQTLAAPVGAFMLTGLAVADLDLDGAPDLLTYSGDTVAIYENEGGGAFAAPVTFDIAASGGELLTGDVNADGLPDILSTLGLGGGGVAVLINQTPAPFFADGFESGDTSSWSAVFP